MSNSPELNALISRASAGDAEALVTLFESHRQRLKRMIDLRMDARIRSRCDASDVLQESYVEMCRRIPELAEGNQESFFVWLRRIAFGRLSKMHRKHLGAQMRTVDREVSLDSIPGPDASSICLASQLAGQFTSVHRNLVQAELEVKFRVILEAMSENDREILALRHFEELSTEETAAVLGLTRSGVLKRYSRALGRLSEAIKRETDLAWTV